jgi:hypothetical protein
MCGGSSDPCYNTSGNGYSSCQKCHDSSGPSQRDCLVAIVEDYAMIGTLPFYEIRGPITLVGQVVDYKSKQPLTGIAVKLVFPNGLTISQSSGADGYFAITLESHRLDQSPQQIELGQMLFNDETNSLFIHLTIPGVINFRRDDKLDASPK